jgi:uncharacterized membrane protein YwzB
MEVLLSQAKVTCLILYYYIAIIWYCIQEFNPKDVFPNKKKKSRITTTTAFIIIDETLIQIGNNSSNSSSRLSMNDLVVHHIFI